MKILALEDVVDLEVGAVCFVRDYVELNFDGPILRCYAGPFVASTEGEATFPESNSRDLLCGLIGHQVKSVSVGSDQIAVDFYGDSSLRIPVSSSGAGPEVAAFVPFVNGRLDPSLMIIWDNKLKDD